MPEIESDIKEINGNVNLCFYVSCAKNKRVYCQKKIKPDISLKFSRYNLFRFY